MNPERPTSLLTLFWIFLRLGLTSFGGPVAHLGYFRAEFVARRQWFTDASYSELVALCQFLPGPASSQVGIAIGLARGGIAGAIVSWLGFTLPSALALTAFAMALLSVDGATLPGWLHGLMVMAVAVVAQAVWAMGRSLCPDWPRRRLALAAAITVWLLPGLGGQLLVIIAGGLIGWRWLHAAPTAESRPLTLPIGRTGATIALGLFFALLALLPLAAALYPHYLWQFIDGLYRAGALVFGGGHVVLPLLQQVVVPTGWVSEEWFLAGYGAAQLVPGPLFTFAAFLGAASSGQPNGLVGAFIATVAIFLPAFLLVLGTLPFWQRLRHLPALQRALPGVNAAVVGLLLAALYHPVITHGLRNLPDLALALLCLWLLIGLKQPAWRVAIVAVLVAWVM